MRHLEGGWDVGEIWGPYSQTMAVLGLHLSSDAALLGDQAFHSCLSGACALL